MIIGESYVSIDDLETLLLFFVFMVVFLVVMAKFEADEKKYFASSRDKARSILNEKAEEKEE